MIIFLDPIVIKHVGESEKTLEVLLAFETLIFFGTALEIIFKALLNELFLQHVI